MACVAEETRSEGEKVPEDASPYRKPYPQLRVPNAPDWVITKEGGYSASGPQLWDQVGAVLQTVRPDLTSRAISVDATACCGYDVLHLSRAHTDRLIALERDPVNFGALQINMRAASLHKRVKCLNADCIDFLEGGDTSQLAQLVGGAPIRLIYFDPPWGGPDVWKTSGALMLGLPHGDSEAGHMPIYEAVSMCAGLTQNVVLKAPPNFALAAFTEKLADISIASYPIYKVGGRKKASERAISYYLHVITFV